MPTPLIIGHRGASALAPENTLISFTRALDDGADGLEFDVHLARDGVPVVIHDDTLRRTAARSGRVAELTSVELGAIDVGSWFNRRYPDHDDPEYSRARISTLIDVFELVQERRPLLYIELKGANAADLAAPVVQMITAHDLKQHAVVESFDHAAIAAVKRIDPEIRTAALFEPTLVRPKPTARKLLARASAVNADEIALHHSMATRRVVGQLAEHGMPVVIWTADSPTWVEKAQRYGIYAIITNNPKILLAERPNEGQLATEDTENTE